MDRKIIIELDKEELNHLIVSYARGHVPDPSMSFRGQVSISINTDGSIRHGAVEFTKK